MKALRTAYIIPEKEGYYLYTDIPIMIITDIMETYSKMSYKELFDKFYANKTEIEEACGFELAWDRLENKKASLACTYIQGLDFDNQTNYPELINKAIDLVLTMRKAFVPFVK